MPPELEGAVWGSRRVADESRELFLWEQKTLRVNARPMTYLDERDADGRLVLLLSTPRPQLPTPPSVDWNGAYIARDN